MTVSCSPNISNLLWISLWTRRLLQRLTLNITFFKNIFGSFTEVKCENFELLWLIGWRLEKGMHLSSVDTWILCRLWEGYPWEGLPLMKASRRKTALSPVLNPHGAHIRCTHSELIQISIWLTEGRLLLRLHWSLWFPRVIKVTPGKWLQWFQHAAFIWSQIRASTDHLCG